MSRVLDAHIRMLQTLPVRTHHSTRDAKNRGVHVPCSTGKEERIRQLARLGWTGKAIERELHVGYFTVRRVLGPLRELRRGVA